jgi:putative membrane protein
LAASADTAEKLGSVKTEILVAWIFALLIIIVWIGLFLFYGLVLGLLAASTCSGVYCVANPFTALAIIYGLFSFIWMIPSIFVFRHTNQMRSAANRGDVASLKRLNSLGWGIVALIFTFIPGIMLLVAHGPIESLGTVVRGPATGAVDLDQLAKLKGLLDSGAITKDEYEAQKNRILHPGMPQPSGIEDELRKLKSLYDSGAITQAEYEDQKRKALSRM